jgi:GNAT superfamily N-acetyltransferase
MRRLVLLDGKQRKETEEELDSFEEYLDSKTSVSSGSKSSTADNSNLKPFDIKVDKSKTRDFDEAEFQSWYKGKAKQLNLDEDPDNPAHFYDYRAAYVAGAEPDNTGHWPSTFKMPGHPRMVVDGVNTKTGKKVDTGSSSFESFLDTKKPEVAPQPAVVATKPEVKEKKGFFSRVADTALQGSENISDAEGIAAVHGGDAVKTLGTGLAAMVPAIGSMLAPSAEGRKYATGFFPVDAVAPVIGRAVEAVTSKGKGKNPLAEAQDRLDRARGIAEFFTAQPTTEEAKAAVEFVSKPLSIIPELATESSEYYKKLADTAEKKGDTKSASAWRALATTTDLGGEVLNFYLLGKIGKAPGKAAKTISDTTWYRKLTIKERALVTELDARVSNGLRGEDLRNAEIRERWKNGTEAEKNAIRNEMVFGIKPREAVAGERPISASGASEQLALPEHAYPSQDFVLRGPGSAPRDVLIGRSPGDDFVLKVNEQRPGLPALPPGVGNAAWYTNTERGIVPTDNHPVRQAVREAIAESQAKLPSPPNLGEGFTTKEIPSTAVIKRPSYSVPGPTTGLEVEYKPVVSKSGKAFPTEDAAHIVAIDRGYKEGSFEVVPVEDGFGFRRVGTKPKMSNAAEQVANTEKPPVQEVSKIDTMADEAKALGVEHTGTYEIPGREPVHSYFDPQTKGNFGVGKGETLEQAVKRHRDSFEGSSAFETFLDSKPKEVEVVTPQGTGVQYGEGFNDAKFSDMRISKQPKPKNILSEETNEFGLKEIKSKDKNLEVINLVDNSGEIIGGISKRTSFSGEVKIGEIYLEPEYRGKGIAQYLYGKFPEAKPGDARTDAAIKARHKYELGKEAEQRANSAVNTPAAEEAKPVSPVQGAINILKGEGGNIVLAGKKPFYSKLESVLNTKMRMSMSVDQLRKTALNNGVTPAEFNDVLGGLKGTVTKQQVMEELAVNGTKFEDVVLGEVDIPRGRTEYDNTTQTHYEQYSVPGYVPGSYRELFVKSPRKGGKVSYIETEDLKVAAPEAYDTLVSYKLAPTFDNNTNTITYNDMSVIGHRYSYATLEQAKELFPAQVRASARILERATQRYTENSWQDGHAAYSDIQNPIVRIRFNERDIAGKRVLFVEEIQGPSAANQAKMPEALRKRIYDIGVKKVLSYAKENGFDEVAWTSGEMQASRYDLSKQINSIQVIGSNRINNIKLGIELKKDSSANGRRFEEVDTYKDQLEEVVGKDLASKILSDLDKGRTHLEYKDLDLKVGGEGLKRLYDQVIPALFKKYGKNEISTIDLQLEPTVTKQHLKIPGAGKQEVLVQAVPITSKTPSSFTMYSGLDITKTFEILQGLKENARAASVQIKPFAEKAFKYSKQVFSDFSAEMGNIFGKMYDKFKSTFDKIFIELLGDKVFSGGAKDWFAWKDGVKEGLGSNYKELRSTVADVWKQTKKMAKSQEGFAEGVGNTVLGEFINQRIVRKSEKSKLEKKASSFKKVQDTVKKEIDDLSSPYGEKKFENLKNKRIADLEKEIKRLEEAKSFTKASTLKRAVTAVKQRNLNTHLAKLKRVDERFDSLVSKINEKASTTFDKEDIKAPQLKMADVEFLKKIPDMKWKPFGGFVENPIYSFEEWGRSVKGGEKKIKEMFVYPIREANKRAAEHFKSIHEKSQALEKSLPKGSSDKIGIYALSKDPEGIKVLEKMKVEVPELTPEELKAYNWMRKGFEVFHEKVNAGRKAAGLEPMGKVDNYFKLAADISLAERLGFGLNDAYFNKYLHNKGTSFTSALERTGGLKKARTDAFNIFNEYMQSATRHMYLSPETAKMREYFTKINLGKGKSIDIKDTHPTATKMVTEYLDFVVGQKKNTFPSGAESAIRFINDNNTIATLSASIRTPLVQPTALANTYAEIGPKYLKQGIAGLIDKEWYDFAIKESDHLLTREFDVNITPTMSGAVGKVSRLRERFNKSWIGMKPTMFLDHASAVATWIGAYKKAIEVDGMVKGSKEAKQYADDVVVKTQGSAAKEDLAPIQRTNIGKFFTTFQTFVINNWNFLKKEVAGVKNSRISVAEGAHKTARILFAMTVINTLFEDVAGINSPLPSPINAATENYEETDSELKAATAAALESLQIMPGVGNLRYGSTILGASPQLFSDLSAKVRAAYTGKGTGREKSWPELAGKVAGVPGTAQATRVAKILERGGSIPQAVIGDYPEDFKQTKKLFRKRFKNAVNAGNAAKANKIQEQANEWNRRVLSEGKPDQVIELE